MEEYMSREYALTVLQHDMRVIEESTTCPDPDHDLFVAAARWVLTGKALPRPAAVEASKLFNQPLAAVHAFDPMRFEDPAMVVSPVSALKPHQCVNCEHSANDHISSKCFGGWDGHPCICTRFIAPASIDPITPKKLMLSGVVRLFASQELAALNAHSSSFALGVAAALRWVSASEEIADQANAQFALYWAQVCRGETPE